MFNDVLGDIIPVLINDQGGSTLVKLLKNSRFGGFFTVLEHTLYHPTAIWMYGKIMDLVREGIDNELDMFRGNSLNGLLNHMIAVLIFHALEDVVFKLFDQLSLLVGQNMLECLSRQRELDPSLRGTHLLDNPTAVHLQR